MSELKNLLSRRDDILLKIREIEEKGHFSHWQLMQ